MKKHLILAVLAAGALAGCSDDAYNPEKLNEQTLTEGITFGGFNPSLSRGTITGADAAQLLGNKFRVYGTYTKNDQTVVVFDNYQVMWNGNKGADETNEAGWTYLGANSLGANPATQEVKYWDLQATRYDFVAFAGLDDSKALVSTQQNRLKVDATNMFKLFASDRRTASKNGVAGSEGGGTTVIYGSTVDFTFSRMTSRVRFGFYETIPGYAITNVRFYYGDNAVSAELSKVAKPGLRGSFPVAGDYVISYGDRNQPVADFQPGGTLTDALVYDRLDYTYAESTVISSTPNYLDGSGNVTATPVNAYLSTTSAAPTMAKADGVNIDGNIVTSEWLPILPYTKDISTPEQKLANNVVLRVDFDLVPLDGTKAVINVYNASAVVPAAWCQWKPNYTYTYIFKITDQIKGSTTPPEDEPVDPNTPDPDPRPAAITPIVFDAEVSSVEDYAQQTITALTGLGGDAITTYSPTSNTTDAGEYGVGDQIVVSSISSGRWSLAYSAAQPDYHSVIAQHDSYTWTVLAGAADADHTIDQNEADCAKFTAEQAGYYIVELTYLPVGRADAPDNYVSVYKIITIHK